MLRFTQSQMDALNSLSFDGFVARAAAYLRANYPEMREMDDLDLSSAIRAAIERAERYGVDDEATVLRFLEFERRHGPLFDETCDWARTILMQPHRDGDRKMDQLDDHELFELALGADGGGG